MNRILIFLLVLSLFSLEGYENSGYLSLGAGVLKPNIPRAGYSIEGRSPLFFRHFRGQVGVMSEEWKSSYVYGGIGFEKRLFGPIYIYPNFSPGIYFQGKGLLLGHPVEFRSSFDFLCELHPKVRLGSAFFHLSNANLGNRNPGMNGIIFYFSFKI